MADLADISGFSALRSHTLGDPRIRVAVLDGPVDLERACFQGANLTRLDPYWADGVAIAPEELQAFIEVVNSGKSDEERGEMLKAAIPNEDALSSLALRFHACHISSTICGQPGSPVEGVAPQVTVLNMPIAYTHGDFINPLNLARAIGSAIAQGANIIHCSACHPTQSGLAPELIDKAIRQAQRDNILIVAPGGNDNGDCWCIPAVLENVLVVGAMKDTGEPFQFSNFGGQYSQQGILAPGENILGAQPGTDAPIRKKGTSCAAPIVTGVAALLMSLQLARGASPDAEAVRAALTNSALPCNPDDVEEPERCLLGRLNIPGAYELLTGEPLRAPAVVIPAGLPEQLELPIAMETTAGVAMLPRNGYDDAFSTLSSEVPGIAARDTAANNGAGAIVSQGTAASAIVSQEAGAVCPHPAVANTEIVSTATPSIVASSIVAPSIVTPSLRTNLVYALGTLGYDFGTEARRDCFKQSMPTATLNGTEVPGNPYDAFQMVEFLEENPTEAQQLIWTLNLEMTPIYAIAPVGAFAADVYEVMQYMLAGQVLSEDDENYIERVSLPGRLADETVELSSGQVVPVLNVNSPRGMYGWNVNTLVDSALQTMGAEWEAAEETSIRNALISFLNRVYYDLSNLGQIARDRALNFAATNAFQAVQTFSEAVAIGMELDSIDVEKSPFCRYGSECWDIKLKFFHPEDTHRARKVFRFTLDVQDIIPVTLGEVRSWSVSQ